VAEIHAFQTAQEPLDTGFEDGVDDKRNGFTSEQYARELVRAF